MKTRERHRKRTAGAAGRGFTLVEVLVVIVILAVLVALSVGVARYVMQKAARDTTIQTLTIILSAINKYYDAQGAYPEEETDFTSGQPTGWQHYGYRFPPDCWQAARRNRKLWAQLHAEPASAAVVRALPKEATYKAQESSSVYYWLFRDGYGRDLDYRRAGGLGGSPVLISSGADGRFTGGTFEADNIRSDGKGQ